MLLVHLTRQNINWNAGYSTALCISEYRTVFPRTLYDRRPHRFPLTTLTQRNFHLFEYTRLALDFMVVMQDGRMSDRFLVPGAGSSVCAADESIVYSIRLIKRFD